jgi:hypothetical protein
MSQYIGESNAIDPKALALKTWVEDLLIDQSCFIVATVYGVDSWKKPEVKNLVLLSLFAPSLGKCDERTWRNPFISCCG